MTKGSQQSTPIPAGYRGSEELLSDVVIDRRVIDDRAARGMVFREKDVAKCAYCSDVGHCMYCDRGRKFHN
jgi:hypothetical protein